MGYRNYIGFMPKKVYNKIRRLSHDDLLKFYNIEKDSDGHGYIGVYDFTEELFEFGKYCDFKPPKGSTKNFFTNKETRKHYEEYELNLVTKDFLKYIIENYTSKVKTYYKKMEDPFHKDYDYCEFLKAVKSEYKSNWEDIYDTKNYTFDFTKITQEQQNALWKIITHVIDMSSEWNRLTPYNLDSGDAITKSWKYEYEIFELVRIYKSFDWKRNVMCYYGY